jgi:hypothetical protein
MSEIDLLANKHAVYLEVEASGYGVTSAPVSTTDGTRLLHTHEPPETPAEEWQFDGALEGEGSPGGSRLPRITPVGRHGAFTLRTRHKPPTAGYGASTYSRLIHALRGHGYGLTYSATPSPNIVLAPARSSYASLAVNIYKHGERKQFIGAHLNRVAVSSQGPTVPVWELQGRGIAIRGETVACPTNGYGSETRSYAKSTPPAAGTPVLRLTAGGQTATLRVREWEFTSEREMTERMTGAETNENGLRHAGFALGNDVVSLSCLVEARTRDTSSPYVDTTTGQFDPALLFENASSVALALSVGTLSANGFSLAAAQASLVSDAELEVEGVLPLWRLNFELCASDAHLADTHTWTFS